MKKLIFLIFVLAVFIVGSINVNASSGRLKSATIKSCNGITYGQHSSDNHWHIATKEDGVYYASGDPIYSDSCSSNNISSNNNSDNEANNNNNTNSTINNNNSSINNTTNNNNSSNSSNNNENATSKQEYTKSNDYILKSVTIDGKNIEISDNMEYKTAKEKVDIKAVTNDNNASYKVLNNEKLTVGENRIIIEVKAENGNIKNYFVNIIREKKLSSNTEIEIIINDEKVEFNNYKAQVNVGSSATDFNLKYTLSDENAKIEIDKINELKTGNNILNIKVIAEDGTEQNYEINIYKYSKFEETIYTLLCLGIIIGIVYGIYKFIKKIKSKKRK